MAYTDEGRKKEVKKVINEKNGATEDNNLIEEPINDSDGEQNFAVVNGCSGC